MASYLHTVLAITGIADELVFSFIAPDSLII